MFARAPRWIINAIGKPAERSAGLAAIKQSTIIIVTPRAASATLIPDRRRRWRKREIAVPPSSRWSREGGPKAPMRVFATV
jgi:hypothetical protein